MNWDILSLTLSPSDIVIYYRGNFFLNNSLYQVTFPLPPPSCLLSIHQKTYIHIYIHTQDIKKQRGKEKGSKGEAGQKKNTPTYWLLAQSMYDSAFSPHNGKVIQWFKKENPELRTNLPSSKGNSTPSRLYPKGLNLDNSPVRRNWKPWLSCLGVWGFCISSVTRGCEFSHMKVWQPLQEVCIWAAPFFLFCMVGGVGGFATRGCVALPTASYGAQRWQWGSYG